MTESSELTRIVVVGASLAGLRASESLRSSGYSGSIRLIGAEDHLPYDRPPLSKKILTGEWEPEQIALRKADSFAEIDVEMLLGVPAVALDTRAHEVGLADGRSVSYDGLIIATGAAPRRLPGQPGYPGIFELRTLDDSLELRAALGEGVRVVVIGAGFIGLEAASSARRLGCRVTVLEGAPAPLIRGLGAEMGRAVATIHAAHDVEIRCDVQVAAIEGSSAGVTGVRLGDGSVVAADVVVVGVGVAPATGWLAGSGLELRDGIVCEASLRAVGMGYVYAAGDCARWPNQLFDEEMRVEHWTNAAEQGALAAANLVREANGEELEAYSAVPFFWSDQYDRRVQFIGRAFLPGEDEADYDIRIVRGTVDEGKFVALYGRRGRLRGVLGLSLPKYVMPFRALLARGASWDEALEFAAGQT